MDRNSLKKLLPRGYQKIVAEKAGVTTNSVNNYLKGKSDNIKIELAILEVLAELNRKRKELILQIQ